MERLTRPTVCITGKNMVKEAGRARPFESWPALVMECWRGWLGAFALVVVPHLRRKEGICFMFFCDSCRTTTSFLIKYINSDYVVKVKHRSSENPLWVSLGRAGRGIREMRGWHHGVGRGAQKDPSRFSPNIYMCVYRRGRFIHSSWWWHCRIVSSAYIERDMIWEVCLSPLWLLYAHTWNIQVFRCSFAEKSVETVRVSWGEWHARCPYEAVNAFLLPTLVNRCRVATWLGG